MLPLERQNTIMSWLKDKEMLRINEISHRLNVSEMTVYRDIQQLLDQGKVHKTSGGITLATEQTTYPVHTCVYCLKESKSKFSVQIITEQHEVKHACCAHCAVLYAHKHKEVTSMLCTDFLIETTLSMQQAFFLVNTDVAAYCCHPQVLTFSRKQDAEKFQQGFKGNLFTLPALRSFLLQEMKEGCKHES